MFISIIIGAIFGFGTAFAAGPIMDLVKSRVTMTERESGMFIFGVMLLAAAFVAAIIGQHSSGFWLILGGLAGAFTGPLKSFGESLYRTIKAEPKKDDHHSTATEAVTPDENAADTDATDDAEKTDGPDDTK